MEKHRTDTPAPPEDLRGHRRYHTRLTGRLIAMGVDVTCTIIDVSAGGARLKADVTLKEGHSVALSIPGIGFMRGTVCRLEGDMISVVFEATDTKTARLRERITKYFATGSTPGTQDSKS